jgi:hypothetical protein
VRIPDSIGRGAGPEFFAARAAAALPASKRDEAAEAALLLQRAIAQLMRQIKSLTVETMRRQYELQRMNQDRLLEHRSKWRAFQRPPNALGPHEQHDAFLADTHRFSQAGLRDGKLTRALTQEQVYHDAASRVTPAEPTTDCDPCDFAKYRRV